MDNQRRDVLHLVGLVALALALLVALPLSASIAIGGVKDIKQARDTISVTGSAKYPIAADLATWHLAVSAQEATPKAAIQALRAKVARVDAFLGSGGLPAGAISKPPISVGQVTVSVPTGLKKPRFRNVPAWRVLQGFSVETTQIDKLEGTAARAGDLLASGTDVSVSRLQYHSTRLRDAKFEALRRAVADARARAATIAAGLGGRLGAVRQTTLGVYQITPRNSNEVSDYGIDDITSRLKDVQSVVNVTFRVSR